MSRPRPTVGPLRPWQFPMPVEHVLDNGLRIWHYDLPGQHIAAASLVLDVPLTLEPEAIEGVATIALRTSDEGTTNHPGNDMAEALEARGSVFSGSAGESATTAALHTPSTRIAQALPLLAEIAQQPAFDAADVDRHVALRLAEIERARVSSPNLVSAAFRDILFADDTRAHRDAAGSPSSVAAITAADVQAFHAANWRPAGATLVLAGELPVDVIEHASSVFGAWTGAGPAEHSAPVAADGPRRIVIVDRPGSVQADVRIGCVTTDRHDPEWPAMQIAAAAVGGAFSSRLNDTLREQRGYTYGAHCSFHARRARGTFGMGASFRTEVTAAAIVETLALLDLTDAPLTDKEVTDAITFMVGVAPLQYDTSEPIAAQASAMAASAMSPDWVNHLHHAMLGVTPAQATAAFRSHVDPAALHIAICGDAEQLVPQLAAVGLDAEVVSVY